MFGQASIMPKRLRFFLSSGVSSLLFFFLLSLPFESRYLTLGVMAGVMVFLWWFGLGAWKETWLTKLMVLVVPEVFFVSFSLFTMLLPYSIELAVILTLFLMAILYIFFLVENIFLVALSFKTVPLYRAAWTVSLLLTLLSSFFAFNSLWSFRFMFWVNAAVVLGVTALLYTYTYWVILIEAGKKENKEALPYVAIPAVLTAELALVLSFWPVGIFNASLYLVWLVFILASLMQADLRERLFRKTAVGFVWMVVAIILAAVVTTSWR